jgi:hypothetical protein
VTPTNLSTVKTSVCKIQNTNLANLSKLQSQNWDIFTIPLVLISQLQRLNILKDSDNQLNLILTLSYGGEDLVSFENAVSTKNRHQFFKLSEKNGVNHSLYRIVEQGLEFIGDLQLAIPGHLSRFTGCYLEQKYNDQLLALTTNAYPESILDKIEIGILDTIPYQEIVLSKFNKDTGLFEDVYTESGVAKLEDAKGYYHPKNFELRDPSVYLYQENYIEFVFCARDKRGRASIGRGFCNFEDPNKPIIQTLPELELDGNYLYLECPQIFVDQDQNQWLLASVGDISGNHYQGFWLFKERYWARANGNGRLKTGLPVGYETYSGKLQTIDNKVFYTCWISNPEGTPNCILTPTLVSLDFENNICSLDLAVSKTDQTIQDPQYEINQI